jgi:predicted ATPase
VAVLRPDNWNDYGFVTMFQVTLWLDDGRQLKLEDVKVLQFGMGTGGRVSLPDRFDALSEDYCSLGQAPSYYEALAAVGPEIGRDYLVALRDAAASKAIADRFLDEPGFSTSLLRFSSAEQALELGRELFAGISPQVEEGAMTFDYAPPEDSSPITFRFGAVRVLPTRLIAVIGYNGVGKTRLLANLAMVAAADDRELSSETFVDEHGGFADGRPGLGAVVAVSYSAFDDFAVPGEGAYHAGEAELEKHREEAGETSARRYVYIGLRKITGDAGDPSLLKSLSEIVDDFHVARKLAATKLRQGQLQLILEPIANEPSFAMVGELPDVDAEQAEWEDTFTRLSAGHKIVLNIIVQLCARLERRSLVLVDEPEMHLHPPLVAAVLKSVTAALDAFDSFGVVATHSPVVVQEIPGRNVLVLRRHGKFARVDAPRIETFGENVSLLTTHIFNLDNSSRDFQGVLRALAAQFDVDEIEALFGGALSSQARAIVNAEKRGIGSAADEDA